MKQNPPSVAIGGMRMTGGVESRTMHVVQGEFQITDDPEVVMVTILGSCVAACLRDPLAGIGGMNHFLLPGDMEAKHAGDAVRQAVHMMELLVNGLLSRGAARNRLEAKIFGGACTMSGLADVGARNGEFAIDFLRRENIRIVGDCLGGQSGRRVQYWPVSGRARRSFMEYAQNAQPVAPKYQPQVSSSAGSLELF